MEVEKMRKMTCKHMDFGYIFYQASEVLGFQSKLDLHKAKNQSLSTKNELQEAIIQFFS